MPVGPPAAQGIVDPFAVMAELDRLAATTVWPGFDPGCIPVALVAGDHTFLFRHPAAPLEFAAGAEHTDARVFLEHHPAVCANSVGDLAGIPTATAILERSTRSLTALAAMVMHETFHVFQRAHHPEWTADEAQLFIHPVEDAVLLHLRRLEATALRRALERQGRPAARWAATAVQLRRERFDALPHGAVTYERGIELWEGLAQYVEGRAAGLADGVILPKEDFAADAVRPRCYAVGQAMAVLLDRFAPIWAADLELGTARFLDELLEAALSRMHEKSAPIPRREREAALVRAKADVAALRAATTALWPRGFDPLNVERVDGGRVLHTRWLRVGNAHSTLEVLGRHVLTKAAGSHPLCDGLREVILAGLRTPPTVRLDEGMIVVSGDGFEGTFHGAHAEYAEQTMIVELDHAAL